MFIETLLKKPLRKISKGLFLYRDHYAAAAGRLVTVLLVWIGRVGFV